MHLPDGFLDTKTALLSSGAAVAGLGFALRQVRETVQPRQVPMLGLGAAFLFAAQMLNFPVAGGTSGHLIGGVLAAVLLGPSAAVLAMTCVLVLQCFMFADGGLTALGANIFNMALVNAVGGYFVFRLTRKLAGRQGNRGVIFAAMFAAWCGTVLASISCAGQLALSGTAPWAVAFPAMANVHMLIGVGEGLATGLILMAILRARPDLVAGSSSGQAESQAGLVVYGFLIALGLALFVSPFACQWPDGLEAVARKLGFEQRAAAAAFPAPVPDYRLPWIGSASAATAAAAGIGTVVAFVAAYVISRLLIPGSSEAKLNGTTGN